MSESPSITIVNRGPSFLSIALGIGRLLLATLGICALHAVRQEIIESKLTGQVQTQSETISWLRWTNGDAQADNAALQAHLDALEVSRDQATHQIAGLKKQVADLGPQAARVPGFEAIIADLKNQVSQLDATVAGLTRQLHDTKVALADARDDSRRAQQKAGILSYTDFVQDAELRMCGKGTTSRLTGCRASVVQAMRTAGIETRFSRCRTSGQAEPLLTQDVHARNIELMGLTGTTNPHPYYVLPCDETLPEAESAVADAG